MCFDWGWSLSYSEVQGEDSVGILDGPRLEALGVFPGRKEVWVWGGGSVNGLESREEKLWLLFLHTHESIWNRKPLFVTYMHIRYITVQSNSSLRMFQLHRSWRQSAGS